MASAGPALCALAALLAAATAVLGSLWSAVPVFAALKLACLAVDTCLFLGVRAKVAFGTAFFVLQGAAGAAALTHMHTGSLSPLPWASLAVYAACCALPAVSLALAVLCVAGGVAYLVRVPIRDVADRARCLLGRVRSVRGQRVFITGGATGFGKELAAVFLEHGASVTLASRNIDHLRAAALELQQRCRVPAERVQTVVCDVTDAESVHAALHGGDQAQDDALVPDIVVTCAGLSHPARFTELCRGAGAQGAAPFRREMELNYFGTLAVVREVVPAMVRRRHGSLVLLSSALGIAGCPGYATYAPSKYAVRGLADTLRFELAPHNVDVHVVFPSNMVTPSFEIELRTKPPEARLIDERALNEPADKSARWVYARFVAGDYAICNNGDLESLYMTAATTSPAAAPVTELIMAPVVWLAIGAERHAWEGCVTTVHCREAAERQQQQQQEEEHQQQK